MRPPAAVRETFTQTSFCRFSYLASGVSPHPNLLFPLSGPHRPRTRRAGAATSITAWGAMGGDISILEWLSAKGFAYGTET